MSLSVNSQSDRSKSTSEKARAQETPVSLYPTKNKTKGEIKKIEPTTITQTIRK